MHSNGRRIPTMEDAERAAAALPGTVIVGGSVARGKAHIESDVDFLCIVDRDYKTGISMHDYNLEVKIKRMLDLPVDVLLVDWPRWISYTKVAASIESVFLREGIMLKWEPPGPDVRWPDALSAEQARRNATKWTLNTLNRALSSILRHVRPDRFSKEPCGLQENDPNMFWRSWENRVSYANLYSHTLIDRALEMLCFATETPRKSILLLFDMLDNLDKFPTSARSVLARQLSTVDREWLRNWQGVCVRGPDNPREPGEDFEPGLVKAASHKYTRMSGVPYDVGVATYVRFAINFFTEVFCYATEVDRSTYGRLHVAVGKIRGQLARLREATADTRWVYGNGTPPEEWPRPWEGASLRGDRVSSGE